MNVNPLVALFLSFKRMIDEEGRRKRPTSSVRSKQFVTICDLAKQARTVNGVIFFRVERRNNPQRIKKHALSKLRIYVRHRNT